MKRAELSMNDVFAHIEDEEAYRGLDGVMITAYNKGAEQDIDMRLFKIWFTTTSILHPDISTAALSIIRARSLEHAQDICMQDNHSYDQNLAITAREEIDMDTAGNVHTLIVG